MTKSILVLLSLVFVGCGAQCNPQWCKKNNYKGVVVTNNGNTYCSNGDLSPNGKSFIVQGATIPEHNRLSGRTLAHYAEFTD